MDISFIIPAYNASATIVRTLDSIYSLPLRTDEFEVIVVDDCSTDDTLTILHNYAAKQPNLCVLHQEQNHRQGAARNRGLREAKGQYVMFVDADDIVEKAVPIALKQAVSLNVDILACNYDFAIIENAIDHRKLPIAWEGKVLSGKQFMEDVYDVIFNTCPINYLWRRNFLIETNIPFVEDRRMEDIDWIEKNMFYSKRVSYLSKCIYTVIGQPYSTTRTTNVGTIADWINFSHRRLSFAEQHKEELPYFYQKVLDDTPRFVYNNTRIRLLSNYSPREVNMIYKFIGNDALQTLRHYRWNMPTKMFINFPLAERILLAFLYPIAQIGRIVIRKIRTL